MQRTIYIYILPDVKLQGDYESELKMFISGLQHFVIMKMDQNVQEQIMCPAQNVMIYMLSDVKW